MIVRFVDGDELVYRELEREMTHFLSTEQGWIKTACHPTTKKKIKKS